MATQRLEAQFARFIATITLLFACNAAAEAALITVEASEKELSGKAIFLDGAFIGLIGDTIDVPRGTHEVRLSGPRRYDLHATLTVSETGAIKLDAYKAVPQNCADQYAFSWSGPRVVSGKKKKEKSKNGTQHWGLLFSSPNFAEKLPKVGCSQPVGMRCTSDFVVVAVQTEPSDAEVWVGEDNVGSTPTKLSLTFCPDRPSTQKLVLRKRGFVNCSQEVTPAVGESFIVKCDLQPLTKH